MVQPVEEASLSSKEIQDKTKMSRDNRKKEAKEKRNEKNGNKEGGGEKGSLGEKKSGPYIHLDFATPITGEPKFTFTYNDDDSSLDSSVQSGLRNSLHSSYDHFEGLEDMAEFDNYSDVDSFGEGDSGHEETPCWRLPPEESGSDWKLIIESVPDGDTMEYNVHKSVLSSGLKKCDTFVSLFSRPKDFEKGFSQSKVHANAASLIPEMLDYLYSVHDLLKISSDTAVGLRHLSQFFGIRALATEVKSFIYEDMVLENLATYLSTANAFDDLATLKLCAERTAESITELDPYSDIMAEMDPSFLLDVISFKTPFRERVSPYMSKFAAVYCELHEDEILDGTVFEELTGSEYLPVIHSDAACGLLVMETQLVEDARNNKRGLTSLQRRCIKAFTLLERNQKDDGDEDGDEAEKKQRRKRAEQLKLLPRKVLVELVAAAYDI